jgi:hypothetical protein
MLSWAIAVLFIFSSAVFAQAPPLVLVSPANGASNQDTTHIVFVWQKDSVAFPSPSLYKLDVSANNFMTSWAGFPHDNTAGINDTSYTAGGFASNTVYYWRVRCDTNGAAGLWSITRVCTTQVIPPEAPGLTSPPDKATAISTTTSLTWNAVRGTVPVTYAVQVSIDPNFIGSDVIYSVSGLTATSASPTGLVYGRTYYWRVSATNSAGAGPWSAQWRFSTMPESYSSGWLYHKNLYLNTKATSGGANVRQNVYNFPLLVRLNRSTFGWFDSTNNGGADIRFTDSVGAPLPYEIERWQGDTVAEIWVRFSSVNALDSTQHIVMYWGNSGATDRSDPYGVFDTASGFAGVWHMNNSFSGADTMVRDRTLNLCNGLPKRDWLGGWGDVVPIDSGVAGKAIWFNTSNPPWPDTGFLTLNTLKSGVFDTGRGITVSAWVNNGTLNGNSRIVDLSEDGTRNKISLGNTATSTTLSWAAGSENTSAASYLQTGIFAHICAVYSHRTGANGDSVIVYKNGSRAGSSTYTYTPGTMPFVTPLSDKAVNFVAKNAAAGNGLFMGVIDELEMSKVARDSSWIRLAYQTQKTGQTALCYPPSIARPPYDTTVTYPNDSVRFSVAATGNNLSYQWQRSDNGGTVWNPVGTNSALYKFKISASDTNPTAPRFRCVVSTPYESVTSAQAVLTVCVPTVLRNASPMDVGDKYVGDTATFTVSDSMGRNYTYQWERSNNNRPWFPASGNSTANPYQYISTWSDTNYATIQFRCIVTGLCGLADTSRAASLALCNHVVISQQPAPAKDSVLAPANGAFGVIAAAGKDTLHYRWFRKPKNQSWAEILSTDASTYVTPETDSTYDSSLYHCIITARCESVTSSDALLRVCTPPGITLDPHDTSVTVGSTAVFHCRTTGSGAGYQWQRSVDTGKTYSDISGASAMDYSFTVTAGNSGSGVPYRCRVTGNCGRDTSGFARVGPCFPCSLTVQPQSKAALIDSPVTFSVTATGSSPTYQWQRLSGTWQTVATVNPYTFTVQLSDSGASFRCIVTGTCGSPVTSNTVMLTVFTRERISNTAYPHDTMAANGTSTSFGVGVTGTGTPSFQWQRKRVSDPYFVSINASTGHYAGFTDSTLLLTPQTDTLDTNALFRCIVTGHYGSLPTTNDTSRAAKLTLCYLPVITAQPLNQINIPPGNFAYFSVNAVGVGTLSYQWQQSAPPYSSWSTISGATGATYSCSTQVALNNYRYQCLVWSGSCTNNARASAYATLTVCALPNIVIQPADTFVIEGDTARLHLTATGTNLRYWWLRNKPPNANWQPTFDTTATLIIPSVDTAYDSNFFKCVITAACDTAQHDTSTAAKLKVFLRAHAYFDMSDIGNAGPWSSVDTMMICDSGQTLNVWFRDTSYGDLDSCVWNFGDSATLHKTNPRNDTIPLRHTYPSVLGIRSYRVTLTASGSGGSNTRTKTVFIYPSTSNPITLRGWYLADTVVELVLTNYKVLRDSAPSPYVLDPGIRLWCAAGDSLPADTLPPVSLLKTYSLGSLKARDSATYRDTVKMSKLVSDSMYSFMTQLHWNSGFNTPPFDTGNGCRVLMRDTMPPVHNLRIAHDFKPWDTVIFRLSDTKAALDPSKVDSVGRCWVFGYNPDFSDPSHTKWWAADTVINNSVDTNVYGDTTGMFSDTVKNAEFNTPTRKMYTVVFRLASKNNNKWTDKAYQFMIGRGVPLTPIKFKAEAKGATYVDVTWKWDTLICNPDSVRVDSFRIWYAPDTAVPLWYTFDTTIYKRVMPDPSVGSGKVSVYLLEPQTKYHFGAQMFLGRSPLSYTDFPAGLWSRVMEKKAQYCYHDDILNVDVYDTMYSRDSAVTWNSNSSAIPNWVRIDTPVVFDTATNAMKIKWRVDRKGYADLVLGISYALRNGLPKDSALFASQQQSSIKTTIANLSSDTGSYTINLDGTTSLVFDTAYYVFLWLRKSDETNYGRPTDSSTGVCIIPPFIWQTTRYHFYTYKADTSYWVNGRVRFITPPSSRTEDFQAKIHAFTPGPSLLTGFLDSLGQSFYFVNPTPSLITDQRFFVGLKCAVPSPYGMQDVLIYRYDSASGRWQVNRNPLYNAASSTVQIAVTPTDASLINNLNAPFIAMIDTQPPQVTWLTSWDSLPKQRGTPVTDAIAIADNVGNLHWNFRSAAGELSFPALGGRDSTLTNGSATVTTTIDSQSVNDVAGARAVFIADDGRFFDTLHLSRRVYRDVNDAYSTEGRWMPLQVTADLDAPAVSNLWKDVEKANGKYDNRYIRLFRFHPDASNAFKAVNEKWLEYAPGLDAIFDLKPGRLMWVKTRVNDAFHLGRGTTVSLKDPDTIMLNPLGWTDFGLPFGFDMRIGDILHANDTGIIRGLDFYQWIDTANTYQCRPFYIVPFFTDSSKVMDHTTTTGFTVYNPANQQVALIIPPICAAMSTYTMGKKAAKTGAVSGGWTLKLLPKTGAGVPLSPVFCGYDTLGDRTIRGYPMPPSFGNFSVGVCEEQSGAMNAHRILHAMHNGGCSYLVAFRNDSSAAQNVSVSVERVAGFTPAMKTALYDQSTGGTVELANTDEAAVTVEGHTTAYRWLLVGDANYIASAGKYLPVLKLALDRVYPNPVRNLVRLRYVVPFALDRVEFTIFTISGRTIWHQTIEERAPLGGSRECQWTATTSAGRRVAAGVYIVRMAGFNKKGSLVGSFNQLLTVLP